MVLPLPGGLDQTPVLSSNSPEIVARSGILLSTFPAAGKASPEAHLDYPLVDRFDVFFHHITDAYKSALSSALSNTLYLGLVAGNASPETVQLRLLDAVSYATKPDAPFKSCEAVIDNDDCSVYAGPGDRVALDLLSGQKQSGWFDSLSIAPGSFALLYNLPLPAHSLLHPLNGRTGFLRLHSSAPIYLASLATFGTSHWFAEEKAPRLEDWLKVLNEQTLVQPRDRAPSAPDESGQLIYGRVAGVAKGSKWTGRLVNDRERECLSIAAGDGLSYPISTVASGTAGTGQVQSAPLLVRYPDTAYESHGNFSVTYDLTIPLRNSSEIDILSGITLQSPLKNWQNPASLQFHQQPLDVIVFRGSIKFEWDDTSGHHKKLIHLVQKQGQQTSPLIQFKLSPQQLQEVKVSLIYPADCTPPQVLTVSGAVYK
jgi:hypothetical protein